MPARQIKEISVKGILNGLVAFTWGVLVLASHVASGSDCEANRLRVQKLSQTVSELEETQKKLNSSFSETVERDLANQVEGLLDDLQRAARAMHEGEVPERSIYGEARPEEAIKLLQDGVPVAPLPFMPARKLN